MKKKNKKSSPFFKLALGQLWISNVSNFIFLVSAYEMVGSPLAHCLIFLPTGIQSIYS